jgi:hypothetical protein
MSKTNVLGVQRPPCVRRQFSVDPKGNHPAKRLPDHKINRIDKLMPSNSQPEKA